MNAGGLIREEVLACASPSDTAALYTRARASRTRNPHAALPPTPHHSRTEVLLTDPPHTAKVNYMQIHYHITGIFGTFASERCFRIHRTRYFQDLCSGQQTVKMLLFIDDCLSSISFRTIVFFFNSYG